MTAPSIVPRIMPSRASDGLRRLSLAHDLPALADLLEVAYHDELALTGSTLVERLRQLANMAPLIGIVNRVAAVLDGYVWIEDGKLVGNITLSHASETAGVSIPQSWAISNVAVLPAYRGRGIGGQLVDAALAYLRTLGARCVLLQVRNDNAPAMALYQHRGFEIYETITEYQLQHRRIPPMMGRSDSRIRPVRWRDGKGLVQLARQNQPRVLRRLRQIRRSDLGLAPWQLFSQALATGLELAAPSTYVAHRNGQLVAYTHLTSTGSRTFFLKLGLAPDQDQELVRSLVAIALAAARSRPSSRMLSQVPTEEIQAQAALEALGFQPLRTLHGMIWRPPILRDGLRAD